MEPIKVTDSSAQSYDSAHTTELEELRAENASLETEVESLNAVVESLRSEVSLLRAELDRITGGGSGPDRKVAGSRTPPADRPLKSQLKNQKERKKRKKRTQNFTRKREPATHKKTHAADNCPHCARGLSGGWEHRRRQIIDIPPAPVQVTDHIIVARHCGACDKRVIPKFGFQGLVVGKHRIGVRLMSVIAYLREVARMTVRTVQETLKSLWGLTISIGEIVALTHDVAHIGKPIYDTLRDEVRQSDYCHSDETGWHEDGVSAELWSLSTPDVRYFHLDTHSCRVQHA